MKTIKPIITTLVLSILLLLGACSDKSKSKTEYDPRVEPLLSKMTLEEKIGQLNQYSNPYLSTGTGPNVDSLNTNYDDMIRKGEIGSFLNVVGAEDTKRLQKIAVEESRLGIPIIFSYDVIHGYKTIFPIPLGEAASFDRKLMEKSSRIVATETAANGIHWTFAPMVDVSRDPRWGRIMEGAGEDVYLGSEAAVARIRGFQGGDLSKDNTIAACAKHFAAYGAAIAGRDYAGAEMSERMLYEVIFPPFKAASDAGVATFMSAFNTINGEPASGSKWLLTDILREQWDFKGFVVSDWASVDDMTKHGIAKNRYEAAYIGLNAGVDMDMVDNLYHDYAKKLVEDKKLSVAIIDEMVRRILNLKFQLGLFDKPYQYCDEAKQKELTLHPDFLKASREVAKASIVLMKNEKNLLPLAKNLKRIAVIGPLGADKDAPIGNWRAQAADSSAISLVEGLRAAVGNKAEITYAQGCKLSTNSPHTFFSDVDINTTDRSGFAQAIQTAKNADVVVMALGEIAYMSGECRSYADISIKGLQVELLREIRKTGKPIILTLFTGRPLVLTDVVDYTDAILNCWLLGSESGNAIADVIFGDYNPSGKLPVTFPYHLGQVPICYEELNTGRPYDGGLSFSSFYRDIPNKPLFPFGFGLSYTTFSYDKIELNKSTLKMNDSIIIKAKISNTGKLDGEEVVQLYIRDVIGNGVSRPLIQLKGFEKPMIKAGKSVEVSFTIHPKDLAFYRLDKTFGPEAGQFEVFIGSSSDQLLLRSEFELED